MTEANSINASTAGILGNTGTSFTGTAITAHDLILGGATSSTLTNVAPSATSGVPVISQGASADPAFGTMVVAGGGTGVTSNTAYAVLCGGTTSTNPIQSIASVGLAGQCLTSGGASALPTMTFVPNPNAVVNLADDFLQADLFTDSASFTEMVTSTSTWLSTNNIVSATPLSTNPGVISHPAFTHAGENMNIYKFGANASGTPIVLGGGAITANWVFKIGTLSTVTNRYTITAGISDSLITNAVVFIYSDNINSGNWTLNCTSGGSTTTSNTTTAATTTGYHNFGLSVNSGATSVSFTIDGVSVGTAITTNIPSVSITPFFKIRRSAGTIAANSANVDLFYMTINLTTAR